MNAVEKLLDPENKENITLYNENNQPAEFEQIALIPGLGNVFVLLRPAQPMEGVGPDEALVFRLDFADEGAELSVEDDDEMIDWVFDQYYQLLEEAKNG